MQKKVFSKKWFFLPAVLLALGIGLMVFYFTFQNSVKEIKPNLTLPGEAVLVLKEGQQSIYYEYVMAYSITEEILFSFENLATGEVIESMPPSAEVHHSIGGRKGDLVAEVVLPETGDYRVSGSYKNEDVPLSFLVGKDLTFEMMFPVLVMIVGSPLCFLGLALFVVFFCLYFGSKRAAAVPPQTGQPIPNGYYYPPQATPMPPQMGSPLPEAPCNNPCSPEAPEDQST